MSIRSISVINVCRAFKNRWLEAAVITDNDKTAKLFVKLINSHDYILPELIPSIRALLRKPQLGKSVMPHVSFRLKLAEWHSYSNHT